jgi:hypothetical protein
MLEPHRIDLAIAGSTFDARQKSIHDRVFLNSTLGRNVRRSQEPNEMGLVDGYDYLWDHVDWNYTFCGLGMD